MSSLGYSPVSALIRIIVFQRDMLLQCKFLLWSADLKNVSKGSLAKKSLKFVGIPLENVHW